MIFGNFVCSYRSKLCSSLYHYTMLSDCKDVMRVIGFDLLHSVMYSRSMEPNFLLRSCILDNIKIKTVLELNKVQCRKVYAILLASIFHRDPNDTIAILLVSASLATHTAHEDRDMYYRTVTTRNMMLKYLPTLYVIKSEELTRKPQQSNIDNPSIIDNQN